MHPDLNHLVFYFLIVDDDHDDHSLLRDAINKSIPQAIVDSVYDGDEALTYLAKCQSVPNLIFLDLNMNRLSGLKTLEIIRANEYLANVPVVIFTTSRNQQEREMLMIKGASDFFTKPNSQADLDNIILQIRNRWLTQAQ